MEIGNTVRLVQPVIQGEILDTQYNKSDKCLEHLVAWAGGDGEVQQRWFNEASLEVVE